ncbi:1,4-dihydroxy-2-naphthoate polyprenyltransferase [Clostridium gasigenes]|uniref:1,4-dihydroxy-2-naphthoate polyprenyltransferase n=1 Tax=Clostridium gasigenes TaxID=94869 RepID=A0A7X0SDX7_9CLOT|nr:1,4-dihydroxy-2-naphthoate polyprenyltransferase [Clostridium gasigenes]MBB6713816.1 1,4-dihydroxy-2-naphthoate polyprenyltransferase [Clostridium gasigenes]
MNIQSFLKLVEIQTKVASVIPFMIGTSYAMFKFDNFNIKNAFLMFLAMIFFDMTTTAINNYMDYKKAIKKDGYGYETHNAVVSYNINPKTVRVTIYIMLVIAVVLGIVLVKNTDIVVLALGIVSFTIGILYSFGPIPISRTPFGEILSGLTMGFIITFISVYIHIVDLNIIKITLSLSSNLLGLSLNINELVSIFIVSIPAIVGISNIMLANNICDIEEDIENKRYTLPIYIGKKNALKIFKALYYIGFISITVGVVFRILPWISLVTLIALKPINNNIKKFMKLQTKKDTFILAVKNFVAMNSIYIVTIIIGIFLG